MKLDIYDAKGLRGPGRQRRALRSGIGCDPEKPTRRRERPLDDEEFQHRWLVSASDGTLIELRKKLREKIRETAPNTPRIGQLHRQLGWLTRVLRERNFWARQRALRGAPESKVERRMLFATHFVAAARAILDREQFAELCRAAEELAG